MYLIIFDLICEQILVTWRKFVVSVSNGIFLCFREFLLFFRYISSNYVISQFENLKCHMKLNRSVAISFKKPNLWQICYLMYTYVWFDFYIIFVCCFYFKCCEMRDEMEMATKWLHIFPMFNLICTKSAFNSNMRK